MNTCAIECTKQQLPKLLDTIGGAFAQLEHFEQEQLLDDERRSVIAEIRDDVRNALKGAVAYIEWHPDYCEPTDSGSPLRDPLTHGWGARS